MRDHVGYIRLAQGEVFVLLAFLPLALYRLVSFPQLLFAVAKGGGKLKILLGYRLALLALDSGKFLKHSLMLGGRGEYFEPEPRRRLVHKIDRLVGEKAVGDIADREVDRRRECFP